MPSDDLLIDFSSMDFGTYTDDASSSFSSQESLPHQDPMMQFAPAATPTTAEDIQLEVSGNSFVMNRQDFSKLGRLPWKKLAGNAYRLEAAFSPDAFEKCVTFLECGSLPKRKKMKSEEKQEVVSMASALGLSELADHMNGKKRGLFGRKK